MNKNIRTSLLLLATISAIASAHSMPVAVVYDKDSAKLQFAVQELERACQSANLKLSTPSDTNALVIRFAINQALDREGYEIVQQEKAIQVSGGDETGLMYGGLELAENVQDGKDLMHLGKVAGKPYMPYRGIKFNIPLDARTPSYDDTGDAAQKNIETMWEFDFWRNYLDNMARYRYNLLTLWNLHPYPSMVKVPGYEDVALNDVCVYTKPITAKTHAEWKGEDIQNPENLKVVKHMTIDEKIAFWKKVFQYAQDRGVDIHLYHWNVFVMGAEGKHGIEWKQDSKETVDYMRASVKQFLLTYPNVKGIGVTAGEHVNGALKGEYAMENWIWLTYGKGIMEARAVNPAIQPLFIFRQHASNLDRIAQAFKDYTGPMDTEFKYSRGRMFSSSVPTWFDHIYRKDVEKYKVKVWMNVRNDDIFNFRWGNPEYAIAYIKHMPRELMHGYFWGPDGYVYGRDFASEDREGLPEFEIDKQWYLFMIWGRAGYDPNLPPTFYMDRIKSHFPGVAARDLYDTWKATSEVIEWVDKIHFRQNDFEFLPEGCFDVGRFHNVDSFCRTPCMPEQGVSSIGDFVLHGKTAGELTPFEVAEKLDSASNTLLNEPDKIQIANNAELRQTLGDLRAMGYLARYYAAKIRGATHLSLYRQSGDADNKAKALQEMEDALSNWKKYAAVAQGQYKPQLFARTQKLDWRQLTHYGEEDVNIVKRAKQGESVAVTGSNLLWVRDKKSH